MSVEALGRLLCTDTVLCGGFRGGVFSWQFFRLLPFGSAQGKPSMRFFALGVIQLCRLRRDSKNVTSKNNLCVGCGECGKKTSEAPKYEGRDFLRHGARSSGTARYELGSGEAMPLLKELL